MSESKGLFQLVVVGSSAGGIEALSTIFKSLPKEFPLPVVIAQHLDPHHPSHLAEILTRRSHLQVVTVEKSEVLQAGTIYVVPSNRHVQITPGEVTVLPNSVEGPTPSIDRLLTTAAEVYGEKLIAVILSGTGSDGSAGAQVVSDTGGTVIIQNPATAAFSGMPQSLAPETVDIVGELTQISGILTNLTAGIPIPPRPDMEQELQKFLGEVLEKSNLDFRAYKPGTIQRRLQLRIAATASEDLPGYKVYLETHPDEYQLLVKNFLIKVTEFMRDAAFYDYLGKQIIPELLKYSRAHTNELRFWSAGCATGEEAYSLAILLDKALGSELSQFTIKVFATDVDSEAIAFARRGIYPANALLKLSDELISSYFNQTEKGFEVKKQIRNLVVFGEHDLGRRAPFPHIDLVLCRNVLIYFNRKMQENIFQLFTFALRDGGYLALGSAEKLIPQAKFFIPQEPGLKVYQRQGNQAAVPLLPNLDSTLPFTGVGKGLTKARPPLQGLAQLQQEAHDSRISNNNILLNLPVGVVVINQHFDIQEINLMARRMLGIHASAIGEDFVHLAEQHPNRELVSAITRSLREKVVTTLPEVQIPNILTGEPGFIQISCYPQIETSNSSNVIILITDVTQPYQVKLELEEANNKLEQAVIAWENSAKETQSLKEQLENSAKETQYLREQLENATIAQDKYKQENDGILKHHADQMTNLVATNTRLLVAHEEQTTSNTELRIASEDYLLRHEEAQAAMEEAETLNEEMQATNEELETLNEEMQATVEELNVANADLVSQREELENLANSLAKQKQVSEQQREQLELILANMQDAVLMVKPDGKPLITNAAYRHLFEKSDKVRLLAESGKRLSENETPAARAARGEKFSMLFKLQLQGKGLRWCEAVGHPVGTGSAFYGGVVVIRDTTEREIAAKALMDSNLRTTNILESISDGFFALDSKAAFTYINHMAEEFVGKPRGELIGKNIWETLPDLANSNIHSQLLETLTKRKPVEFENFSSLSDKWVEVKAYPAEDRGITVYFRDISQRKLEEKQKIESLGILAGGIAHDFNNLLSIITGNIGLLKLEVEADTEKNKILDLFSDLEGAAYRAKGLTQQLLTFSSGGAPVKELVHLPALLKEWLQFTLGGTNVEYHLECSKTLWLVEIDAGQLSQVINNLALNSSHAMPAGGNLIVKVKNIVFKKENQNIPLPVGNYIKLSIQDQGCGIEPEVLKHIFEPYFTTRPHGHGLGLSIVYSIVHRHDGFIGVKSVVGEGTTFTIYLPAKSNQEKQVATGVKPLEKRHSANPRILILEDELVMQRVLTKLLSKLGYEVELTADGSATVAHYLKALKEEKPYSVLILDLHIPNGKGGEEVLKELLELDPNVTAIVSSGYNAGPVIAHYRDYGFKGILSKPYTVEQLRQVLNEV